MQLDQWECSRNDDSLLVFSELVTNAVMHGGGATDIVVTHGHLELRFDICDRTAVAPEVSTSVGAAGGFGLKIDDRLSHRWGWEHNAHGKCVWSVLDCCGHDAP